MPSNRPDTYLCDHCSYNLTGLPEEGNCPECGFVYSTRSLVGVKVPQAGYERGEKLARRIKTILLAFLALTALTCGGALSLVVPRPDRAWAIGGMIAALFLLAAVISYMGEKE